MTEDVKIRFSEIIKINVFQDHMHGSIPIKTYRFQEIVILKQQNAKSVTDASICGKFISKNSNSLEILEHCLLNSPVIIPRNGFHFRSTNLADKPHL